MAKDQWNPNLYDAKHAFVSQYGNDVVELLAPEKEEKILDLGCGTGDLTKRINDMGANVTGVDQSENMIEEAKNKYSAINFSVIDALDLMYVSEFDAVFSNATLHWIKKPKQALQCIYHSLKSRGRFVAEFGGEGNVQTITDEVIYRLNKHQVEYHNDQFPWYFPSIGEYTSFMEKVGFQVTYAYHFDRPTPLDGASGLSNWIEMFGNAIFAHVDKQTKENIINEVQQQLKEKLFIDGIWMADYKRLRVVGIKND